MFRSLESFRYLLKGCHLTQPPNMPLGLAEFRREKRLDQVPGDRWPDRPAAHADHIHVVVLDALSRGEMIANQAGTNSRNLVGADRGADAASAYRYPALHFAFRYRSPERDDEIGIVVAGTQTVRTEV